MRSTKQGLNLGRSKLSSWFKGTNVPEADASFELLVQLLEARARNKPGVAVRGMPWWRALQKEAAVEREATGALKPTARTVLPAPYCPPHRPKPPRTRGTWTRPKGC